MGFISQLSVVTWISLPTLPRASKEASLGVMYRLAVVRDSIVPFGFQDEGGDLMVDPT